MNRIKDLSPLTETTFYILIALLEPLHGYGIMQKVIKLSRGRIHLGPGTLYGRLDYSREFKKIKSPQKGLFYNQTGKEVNRIRDSQVGGNDKKWQIPIAKERSLIWIGL